MSPDLVPTPTPSTPLDQVVKRAALYAAAFLTFVTVAGLLNKWVIADPMTRATSKIEAGLEDQAKALGVESAARRTADAEILGVVQGLKASQETVAAHLSTSTYTRGQIDEMRRQSEQDRAEIRTMVESLRAELARQRAAKGRP